MSLINNGEIIGNSNKDLILETSGNLYIKVKGQLYEIDFRKLNNIGKLVGTKVDEFKDSIKLPEVPVQKEIDLDDYITSYDLKQALKNYVTNRTFKDVQETQEALINSKLDGFTESINPITVQTMQVSVGSEQLQFQWIENFTSEKTVEDPLKVVGDDLMFTPGYIQHMTLDGPEKVAPSNDNYNNIRHYWRWYILNGNLKDNSVKIDIQSDTTYYVYLKVPNRIDAVVEKNEVITGVNDNKQTGRYGANVDIGCSYDSDGDIDREITISDVTLKDNKVDATADTSRDPGLYCKTGVGYLYVTTESKKFDEEFDWYYLLYAIVTTKSGTPSISTMNGFTEITPGQIKASLFSSPDGSSYIDFKNNKFKLGNSLTYEEIDESGSLKIVGEITANMFRCPFKTISGVVNKNTFDNSTNLIFSAIEQTHLLLDKDSKWDGVTINVYYPGYYENKLKGTNNASIIEGIIMWPDKSVNQNNEWTTYNQIYLRKGPVFITFIYINNFWIITKAIGDISTTLNDI